jgi:hypothetical protein
MRGEGRRGQGRREDKEDERTRKTRGQGWKMRG